MQASLDQKPRIVFFAHRRRFVPYFKKLSEVFESSNVITVLTIFKHTFRLHKPPKVFAKEVIEYELSKRFYKNQNHRNVLLVYWFSATLYVKLFLFYSGCVNYVKKSNQHHFIVWGAGGFYQKIFAGVVKQSQKTLITMENGFLPNTTVVDAIGVNANCSLPKDKDFYLNLDSHMLPEGLPDKLVVRQNKKVSSQESVTADSLEKSARPFIFIPFQCNQDSVIIWHSPNIKNMWEYFDCIIQYAKEFPQVDFIIKEHPSCPEDYTALYKSIDDLTINNVLFKNSENTEALIKNSAAVMIINSSVGFESLLFGKPVISLGNAAYNIDGLVLNAKSIIDGNILIRKVIAGWQPDTELLNKFLRYVYHCYLIRGTRKDPNDLHKTSFKKKIDTLLNL